MTEGSRGRHVVVFGGAGYIGSHLCRQLLAAGWRVTAFDRLLFGEHGVADLKGDTHFTLCRGDLRNLAEVSAVLETARRDKHSASAEDQASSVDVEETALSETKTSTGQRLKSTFANNDEVVETDRALSSGPGDAVSGEPRDQAELEAASAARKSSSSSPRLS